MLDDIRHLIDVTWEEAFAGIPKQKSEMVMELLDTVRSNLMALDPLPAAAASAARRNGGGRTRRQSGRQSHERSTSRQRRCGARRARRGRGTRLQRLRWPLMLLVPVLLAGAIYFYLTGGRYQSTDDAYTQAATVSISANVAGRVLEIYVHDNEIVKRGDSLYRLDDAPFRIAVSDAEAKLASTRLQIASLKSTYRQKQVELHSARDSLAYAQRQFDRN